MGVSGLKSGCQQAACLLEALRESVSCRFQPLEAATFLDSWPFLTSLQPLASFVTCLNSSSDPLIRTLMITFGVHPDNPGNLPISRSLISSHLQSPFCHGR